MLAQQKPRKRGSVNAILEHADVTSNAESAQLANDTYERAQDSMQSFKLDLVASSQTLRDAPQSRSALMASIETELRPIHPLYRIPPETWTSIFKLVLLANSSERHSPISPRNAIQIIGNVCHGWRTVIQSLPELWSELSFSDCWNIPSSARDDIPAFLLGTTRILTHVLNLSKNLPLDITVRLPKAHNEPLIVHALMIILTQHSHRWARITIDDDSNQSATRALTSSLSSLGITTLPLFEYFHVAWTKKDKLRFSDSSAFPRASVAMPKLRSLSLSKFSPDYDSSFIPWSQLECLSMSWVSPHASLRLSNELTSLTKLYLRLEGEGAMFLFSGSPSQYELPNVDKLRINKWNDTFFSTMRMPKLRILAVETLIDNDCNTGFSDVITRSKCTITEFTCRHYRNQEPDQRRSLQKLLRSLPGLQNFIFYLDYDEGVLDVLKLLKEMKRGRMRYCPQLQMLDLSFEFSDMGLFGPFVDAIESRWRTAKELGLPGLQEVGIIAWDDDDEDSKAGEQAGRLDRLREEGLDVDVPRSLLNRI